MVTGRQLTFLCVCGHIWHTKPSNLSLFSPQCRPIIPLFPVIAYQINHIGTLNITLIINKLVPMSLSIGPLPRFCLWLPFAAVTTSALCGADICMQIWPKFEIICLNFVDWWHFATEIASQELPNALCRWMRQIFREFGDRISKYWIYCVYSGHFPRISLNRQNWSKTQWWKGL